MSGILKNKAKLSEARSSNPDPIDIHVGARLRMRRNLVGLSQDQLAKSLGLTFQQIQKYERGVNRMGSSRLFQISRLLAVPVSFFFEDIAPTPRQGSAEDEQASLEGSSSPETSDYAVLQKRETLELVRAYYRIQDPKQRRKVYELIRSMSDEQ